MFGFFPFRFKRACDDLSSALQSHKTLESLIKWLGIFHSCLSDSSDTGCRQEIFSLLFLGKAIRKADDQLMQIHVVYADNFIAEDVVQ